MGGVEGGEGGTTELELRRQTGNLFGGEGGLEDLFGDRKIWQILRYIYTYFWQLDLSRNFKGCSKQSGAHNARLAVQTARGEKTFIIFIMLIYVMQIPWVLAEAGFHTTIRHW